MRTITIGRGNDNTIVVDANYKTVSGYHATIYVENGEYVLEDHSSNGTYINGTLIQNKKLYIYPNDVILLSTQYKVDNSMIFKESYGIEHDSNKAGRGTVAIGQKHPVIPTPVPHPPVPPTPPVSFTPPRIDATPAKREPNNLHSFNFGAFFFGWLWGVCNGVYLALLSLIPAINFIMCIILGVKGNEWAWEKQKNSISPDEFEQSQSKWVKAALIVLLVVVASVILYFVFYLILFSAVW